MGHDENDQIERNEDQIKGDTDGQVSMRKPSDGMHGIEFPYRSVIHSVSFLGPGLGHRKKAKSVQLTNTARKDFTLGFGDV